MSCRHPSLLCLARARFVKRRLTCEECGCISRGRAKGWTAFLGEEVREIEPLSVGIFCPRCAALECEHSIEEAGEFT